VSSRSKLPVSVFDKDLQITFDMHSLNVTFFFHQLLDISSDSVTVEVEAVHNLAQKVSRYTSRETERKSEGVKGRKKAALKRKGVEGRNVLFLCFLEMLISRLFFSLLPQVFVISRTGGA
jgi:hypothetical protein